MKFRIEVKSDAEADMPFDVGFQSGLCGQSLFECPYDHQDPEGLRFRHEWLNGYLTALASQRMTAPF
ncbi:hypothetical protein [Pseudomonas sp. B1-22]|uniref:hypothetical protein n=1 Tax=Pseudomonas sp. B1-22 TaxID=3141456 RepID=UPI003D2A4B91